MDQASDSVHARAGDAPKYVTGRWRLAFEASPPFTPLETRSFRHVQRIGCETLVDRVASTSYIAALPEDEHEAFRAGVRELLAERPETRGREILEVPYRTDVFVCTAAA